MADDKEQIKKKINELNEEIKHLNAQKREFEKYILKVTPAKAQLNKASCNLEIAYRNLKKYYSSKNTDVSVKRKQILHLIENIELRKQQVSSAIDASSEQISLIEAKIRSKKNKMLKLKNQ